MGLSFVTPRRRFTLIAISVLVAGAGIGIGVALVGNGPATGAPKVPVKALGGLSPPASINATCATDDTAAMESWLLSLPNGTPARPTKVTFSGCYLVNGTLWLRGFRYFTFTGGTFKETLPTPGLTHVRNNPAVAPYCGSSDFANSRYSEPQDQVTMWWFDGGCGITFSHMTIDGPDADGASGGGRETDTAIQFNGTQVELVDDVTIDGPYGDYVDVAEFHDCGNCGARFPGTNLTVENCTFNHAGRVGIGIINAARVTIEHNTIGSANLTVFDVEVDCTTCTSPAGYQNDILIADNTIVGQHYAYILAAYTSARIARLRFTGNNLIDGAQLRIVIRPEFPGSNIRIDHNTATAPNSASGSSQPAIRAVRITGMEVDSNTVPVGPGGFADLPPGALVCGNSITPTNEAVSRTCPQVLPAAPPALAVLP
jgi:Right handed beta helix region